MQIFFGPQTHSESDRRRLLEQMHANGVPVTAFDGRLLYCLDLRTPLDGPGCAKLLFLLGRMDTAVPSGGVQLRVLPRAGTISPWSSKATDILHIAGLPEIRRIECGRHYTLESKTLDEAQYAIAASLLHDRMTEQVFGGNDDSAVAALFAAPVPRPLEKIPLGDAYTKALADADRALSLGLSDDEINYLDEHYRRLGRAPTDAELMMFAQVNSEHCRHKIFNAVWTLDGYEQKSSLFDQIRHTRERAPERVLSAYDDNAAVIEGADGMRWQVDPATRKYGYTKEPLPILMKVETHNHPTAISPFPGAATGSGGEIRDEAATGRGGRPKAGLCGFSVSDLRLPDASRIWEDIESKPAWIASPLRIMLEAPIGAAAFNNEFGRPCLAGYFRTFEHRRSGKRYGYHKPIMLAGGFGSLRRTHVHKQAFPPGTPIVVLGGPAMLIGLRGGTASSRTPSTRSDDCGETLDFASVQRSNAEMQRRCQEVIEHCAALGERNPILAIHDVGAGGLSNAVPELVAGAGVGGRFELREIPNADEGMSPMEIWCNEAQERYVLAIEPAALEDFVTSCKRERCPVSVIGEAIKETQFELSDRLLGDKVISMPLPVLFGKVPKIHKDIALTHCHKNTIDTVNITVEEAVKRVLALPAVGSKSFLVTIGDRTVGGLTVRDQMVGPWQVPVADCAVCATDFVHYTGEAMAIGERTPAALLNAPASGRLAVAEAVTNMLAADVRALSDIRISANWMAACGDAEDDLALFQTVQAVAGELCPALGIAIPVGKDSLSMQTTWRNGDGDEQVKAPLSLIASAFAPVGDVRRNLTPELSPRKNCPLFLFDLSGGQRRLGGSALAQVFNLDGGPCADLDDPDRIKRFFALVTELKASGAVLAYHDRSDGGLFVTLCEMAFAAHCGLKIALDKIDGYPKDALAALFSEEPGVVLQIVPDAASAMTSLVKRHKLADACHPIGHASDDQRVRITVEEQSWNWDLMELKRRWWETSYRIQSLRDDPDCAREEFERTCNAATPGLKATLSFDLDDTPSPGPFINRHARPEVAILREQGVNGHMEMAAAFDRAGFTVVDVHMSDLLAGDVSLARLHGLAAGGGFSYGDVLGAGRGWAASALFHDAVRAEFEAFFKRDNTFTLGACNGCQMLSQIKELIPGAAHFPRFEKNRSNQFEARLCMVEVMDSPSILLRGMAGSHLPITIAHGEGRVVFENTAKTGVHVCLRYTDRLGHAAETYPDNPNGSPGGITAMCSEDGRVTVMMPHPERLFRSVQYSWCPEGWNEVGPWFKLFRNARDWLDSA